MEPPGDGDAWLCCAPCGVLKPDQQRSASSPVGSALINNFMYLLKVILRIFLNLIKQTLQLPHSVAIALQQKRNQNPERISEKERLDRIRNPAKYAGR
jgi:hypothetical protein